MGNVCSSRTSVNESNSESATSSASSCCIGRRGRWRTHAQDEKQRQHEQQQHQQPIMGNGSSGKSETDHQQDGASTTTTTTKAPVTGGRPHLPQLDVREESSMASVDSDVMLSPPPPPPPASGACPAAARSGGVHRTGAALTSPTSACQQQQQQRDTDLVDQLPDAVRQVVLGSVPSGAQLERGAHITVYVASADPSGSSGTWPAVLEAIKSRIEPEMKARAALRGVCLRVLTDPWTWPSASASSGADHRLGRISLANLKRLMETSHVVPVLVFGDTLGRTCLPPSIEAQDFQTALDAADDAGRSLAERWYKSDALAQPPCYRLHAASQMTDDVQQRLLEFFVSVFTQELSDAYLNTLFEQQVHYSVCMSQEMARRCVWLQDSASASVGSPAASPASAGEREHRRRVAALHRTLKGLLLDRHVIKCQSDAQTSSSSASASWCHVVDPLANVLAGVVDELLDEMDAREAPHAKSPLSRSFVDDVNQHLAFCQRAASSCVNRDAALMVVKRYLTGAERHPLIVHGAEGSGKTSLLARSGQQCHTWQTAEPLHFDTGTAAADATGVLLRFVRLTPQSASAATLLRSLVRQASLLVAGRLPHTLHTLEDCHTALKSLLDDKVALASRRKMTFLLDGVDQLDDFDADLLADWLPDELPVGVKLVVSVRSGEHVARLRPKLPDSAFFQLDELAAGEARNLFDACLLQQAHSSHGDHLTGMAGQINQSHRPLTVKAGLAEEFRSEPSSMPCSTNIIPNLTCAFNELTGHDGAAWLVALVTSSRCGVSDADADRLCRERFGDADGGARCWPALLHLLSPFVRRVLVAGTGLWSWRDPTIRQQMAETFLADPAEARAVHRLLLDHFWRDWQTARCRLEQTGFADLAAPHPDFTRLRLTRRALDEIPHHLSKLDDSADRWREIWSDPVWVMAKLATSGVACVLDDVQLTPEDVRPEPLRQWLVLSAPALDYDHRQVAGQLAGRGVDGLFDRVLVPSLVPSTVCLRANRHTTDPDGQVNTSAIYRLSGSERHHAAVLSAVRDEMSLWDFTSGKCDRVLGNLQHQPLKVAPLSNDRCVVLCGRELRIYDIHTGDELLKLKGMMNQKLPLFGLHGDSHVVSLSRNRMYVNLISLENGDCVTTFKVGEDRFLNSLLVSDNGRILVCGDESKRPCSLLVWDLQTKKLIYDLKMNHHEFITRLSAITGDGTYVACVCKELETTDPNFIVVYDLQSGTLFKKWKAGANTVAVSIACENSCVVTSLQDAKILVWDLGTGNCRWTLTGHSSAVDTLNLDAEGRFLLSWDSLDNDRSLRLWNLENGQDVATFTPDQRTTAAQISADGHVVLLALAGRSDLIHLKLSLPSAQS